MWGLIAAAALTAAPPPAVPMEAFLKDIPGVTSAPTLPVNSKVDGVDIQQRTIRSSKSPDELREFFGNAFAKAGLYIPPDQDTISAQVGVQVTGLDTDHLISYTVLLQPATKGTTIVLAAANLGKKAALNDPIAPVFPGGASVTSYTLENLKAMTYSVSATPADIKTFYFQTLTGAGFKDTGEPDSYIKGNQKISVTISPGMSEQGVMVKLETVAGGPPPPMPPLPKTYPTELPKVKLPKFPEPPPEPAKPAPAPPAAH